MWWWPVRKKAEPMEVKADPAAVNEFNSWLEEHMHTPAELRMCQQLPTTTQAERGHSYNFRPLVQDTEE